MLPSGYTVTKTAGGDETQVELVGTGPEIGGILEADEWIFNVSVGYMYFKGKSKFSYDIDYSDGSYTHHSSRDANYTKFTGTIADATIGYRMFGFLRPFYGYRVLKISTATSPLELPTPYDVTIRQEHTVAGLAIDINLGKMNYLSIEASKSTMNTKDESIKSAELVGGSLNFNFNF